MIIDCQLKGVLKNYLETVIVGFGQADVLGLILLFFKNDFIPLLMSSKSIKAGPKNLE
jgi:hypothetical protein